MLLLGFLTGDQGKGDNFVAHSHLTSQALTLRNGLQKELYYAVGRIQIFPEHISTQKCEKYWPLPSLNYHFSVKEDT